MPRTGRMRGLTREQHEEIHRLRDQGLSFLRIASATGIPPATVARYAGLDPDPDPRGLWDLDEQPYGPVEHALAKKALGLRRVEDTFVLSDHRDPFYAGKPAQIRDAEWYGQLWRDLGMPNGGHTRRVHYRADAVGSLKPDGTVYDRDSDRDWSYLTEASAMARYLRELDVEAMADKRSGGVSANVSASRAPGETPAVALDGEIGWDGWSVPEAELPHLYGMTMPQPAVSGYEYETADQPVLIEVWCEKSTMDDILAPLCRRFSVNLASEMKGYESITHIVELLRRAEEYPARKAVVLYVSDNDGAGDNMPVAVARQAQFWTDRLGIDAEVLIHSIVLTDEQVAEFGLPKNKDGSTELDALEALRPGELARIVEDEIKRWRDPELAGELATAEADAQEQISQDWEEATGELATELAAIRADAEAIIAEYQPLVEQVNQRFAGLEQRLADLAQRVHAAADDADWELPDRPEPAEPEVPEDILYDSSRHWLTQLQAYREHRGQPPLNLPEDYR